MLSSKTILPVTINIAFSECRTVATILIGCDGQQTLHVVTNFDDDSDDDDPPTEIQPTPNIDRIWA